MKIARETAPHYKWGDDCDGWHLLGTPSLGVIQERMPPGTRESSHFHHKSQQLFYILAGVATFTSDKTYVLTAGECIHVPNVVIHSISNEGTEVLEFLVISEPMAHGDRTNVNNQTQ